MSRLHLKHTQFGLHKYSWKCREVYFKTPTSVTTNTAGNGTTLLEKYLVLVDQTTAGNAWKSPKKHPLLLSQTCQNRCERYRALVATNTDGNFRPFVSTNRAGEIQRLPSKHPILMSQTRLKMETHPALVSTNTNKKLFLSGFGTFYKNVSTNPTPCTNLDKSISHHSTTHRHKPTS